MIDLTLMFGSGNEPTSTDDPRIAWIELYAADHLEYNAGELVSADVESIQYNDAVILDIPASVRTLPGYGWSAGDAHNSIERTDDGKWQYVQRVGSVDLGMLEWNKLTSGNLCFSTRLPDITTGKLYNALICSRYTTSSSPGRSELQEYEICQNTGGSITAEYICILDNSYQSASEFKTAMSGVMLYYELAKPVITDITDLMDGVLDAVTVEAGGTLTFENAAKMSVPNTVEYAVKLSEVGTV